MSNRRNFLKRTGLSALAAALGPRAWSQDLQANRPNVLWLVIEDTSAHEFACYGHKSVKTPNVDALAKRSVQFMRAWSTGSQCSPARSSLITGSYSTTYGMDIHRHKWPTPPDIFYPQLLRDAGYYCTNNSKTDYNSTTPNNSCWDESGKNATYNDPARKSDQPFFAVFNNGATHMSRVTSITLDKRRDFSKQGLDPDKMFLPPHVPDLPEMRSDQAYHLEGVQDIDKWVGLHLKALKDKGLDKNTIVFFYGDHGGCLPRGKGFMYETGLRVPMLIHVPEKYRRLCPMKMGTKSDRLVGFVDFGATMLSLAGIEPPSHMQGRAFMGPRETTPRKYQFGLRANQASHYDPARAMTDGRFKYIRYFTQHRPLCVRNYFQWQMPANIAWDRYLFEIKGDKPEWRRMGEPKNGEELYDLEADPWELNDLSGDRKYMREMTVFRKAMSGHLRQTRDLGLFPRSTRLKDGDKPLHTWVRETNYPLGELIAAAEMAGDGRAEDADKMIALLNDERPEMKFWGAMGLAGLGCRGRLKECPKRLLPMTRNKNPEIVAAACEAACVLGRADVAMPVLMKRFNDGDANAGCALEVLTLHKASAEAVRKEVPTFRKVAEANPTWSKAQRARAVLINLGDMPAGELYEPKARAKGVKVNTGRKPQGPLA